MFDFFKILISFLHHFFISQYLLFTPPLIIFIIFRRSDFINSLRSSPVLRLLLSFLLVVFSIRVVLYLSAYPYQGRYFHPITILSVFPVSLGFLMIADYFGKKLNLKNARLLLILIVVIVACARILNPPKTKTWLKDIPEAIKANAPQDRKIILISAVEDGRLPYYSGAELRLIKEIGQDKYIPRFSPQTKVFTQRYYKRNMKWFPEYEFGSGPEAIYKAVEKWGGDNVFILFNANKNEVEDILTKNIAPSNIKFIAEFKKTENETVSLYQGIK